MSRNVNPRPQFFDSAGDPLGLGKMYYFDSGTDTAKVTYADVNQTIANTHPVLLTADGRLPNVFFSGSARQKLTDSDDVQLWDVDPVGADDIGSNFDDWNPLIIYDANDIVQGSDDKFYISINAGNQNNDPTTTPSEWAEIEFVNVWNVNVTYQIGNTVKGSDNLFYNSLTANNLGNDPVGDVVNWGPPFVGVGSVVAGTGITVDATDPNNPIVAAINNGNVVGPVSSVDNEIALFDGATGKLLKVGPKTGTASGNVPLVGTKSSTTALAGLVEKSDSGENIAGTDDTVWPTVAGTKEMIDTHAGDVVGPASATDHVWPRFDTTTGKLLQDGTWAEDDSGNVLAGGTLGMNGKAINESEGAAVASATTTDIFGGDDGNTLHITGTTTIVDFTDASSAGQWRKIIFDGILTLTHGSGITLPGSANITTAVGDYAFVYADAVGAFTVLYFKADGTAVVAPSGLTLDTEQATTSGSTVTFGSLPAETKQINVMLNGVSTNGTGLISIQLGDAGGLEPTGYISVGASLNGATTASTGYTTGFAVAHIPVAAENYNGVVTIVLEDAANFTWTASGSVSSNTGVQHFGSGSKSLSAELTQIAVITANTFDAGAVNISYQ